LPRLRSTGIRLLQMGRRPYCRGEPSPSAPATVNRAPAARLVTVARGGFGLLGDRIDQRDLAAASPRPDDAPCDA
jgi:hypothetical protein